MAHKEKLMQRAMDIIEKRGQKAVSKARQLAQLDPAEYEPLSGAIKYFMDEFWYDYLHPALISFACEALGGNVEDTINIGAALVLLAGAADIHDDIIDESKIKKPYVTVYGKFGRDTAMLTGDSLLMLGLYVLSEEVKLVSEEKQRLILESVKQSYLKLCTGEAREAGWKGKTNISKEDYLEIIGKKSAASETATRIGAIFGGGTEREIELLGHYGRIYGVLMTIRNEFIDMFEPEELMNRYRNECLPLPILIAFQDNSIKAEIVQLLEKELTEKSVERILDLSIDFRETQALIEEMKKWADREISNLPTAYRCREDLVLLLQALLEDL
ncbi:MAG: polyprenyl synthetase family protein [Candidatus Bathyarchaeia archaeon]|jgi:geranylgeranyl pyrophosphate synthase